MFCICYSFFYFLSICSFYLFFFLGLLLLYMYLLFLVLIFHILHHYILHSMLCCLLLLMLYDMFLMLFLFTPYNMLPFVSFICVGNTLYVSAVPIPNCPYPLYPVLHTLPSASSIEICCSPAVIWIMFDTFAFLLGMDLHFRLLLYCFQIVHNSYIHKNIHFHLLLMRVMYCFLLLFVLYFVNILLHFLLLLYGTYLLFLLFRLLIVLYYYILLPRLFHLFLILMCGMLLLLHLLRLLFLLLLLFHLLVLFLLLLVLVLFCFVVS